jgi:Ala-tRNA(Pro) deacylase
MNKQEIYDLLNSRGLWHEITEHGAVWNMEDLAAVELPYPEADAKNLFVRDDKKRNYYLITILGSRSLPLKEFQQRYGTRRLSFASEKDLQAILGLYPGAVTPFGLLNDQEHRAELYLDPSFLEGRGIIGVHPNDNTATVWMKTRDLIALLKESDISVHIMDAL